MPYPSSSMDVKPAQSKNLAEGLEDTFFKSSKPIEIESKMPKIPLDILEILKIKASKVFCFVFLASFKISNFNVWTDKHSMQASWTELALK